MCQCVALRWDVLRIYSKPSCLDSPAWECHSLPIAPGTLEDRSLESGFGYHGYHGSKIPENKQIFTVGSPIVIKLPNHQLITSPTWSLALWNDIFHLPFEGTKSFYLNWWGATTSGHLCSHIPRHPGGEAWASGWCRWPQVALDIWRINMMKYVVDVQVWIAVSNWLRFGSDDFETIRLCSI